MKRTVWIVALIGMTLGIAGCASCPFCGSRKAKCNKTAMTKEACAKCDMSKDKCKCPKDATCAKCGEAKSKCKCM